MSKINIIPIFVPHLGCPNDCVFCNQNKITNTVNIINKEVATETIETYIGYFKDKSNIEIAFYGGSFTAIETDLQKELLEVAKKYKNLGIVKSIRLSTRPDCIDREILDRLLSYKVDIIELGVQSLDENVLKKANRGHNSKCVYDAVSLIREYNFKLGLQQMVGLPGDTIESSIYTANEFAKLKPDFVRIYPTLVIKNTQLEIDLKSREYKALSLEDAVKISKELLKIYIINEIEVIRIGLQPTDNIQLGRDVIDGPFHPSFRQLVESELLFDIIINKLKNKKISNLKIISNGKNISNIAGQKAQNKIKIINVLNLKSLSLSIKNMDSDLIEIVEDDNKYILSIKKEIMEKKCI